jgi:ATP-dependent HslUV protease, peptidase subunit HslV
MLESSSRWHGTTILGVKRNGEVAMAGDGQVTYGDVVMKHTARKIRVLASGRVIAGFAGAVADALMLIEKFEGHLRDSGDNLVRASVELAKEWRSDRYLRRLEAQLIIADCDHLLVISGEGDVLEPDDGVLAIGTGGSYAIAAARALLQYTEMTAREIAQAAMLITADLCIFTNKNTLIEVTKQADEA